MTDHVRRLAVFVDEPDPGDFYWVLIESQDDASVWEDLEHSGQVFHSWDAAYQAGTKVLLAMVKNREIGPRAPGESEDSSPVGGK